MNQCCMHHGYSGLRIKGFTLIELITVLILVGVLSAVALPRMFSRGEFDSRAFIDQTAALLRYAQKTAIAQRRTVCVSFGANQAVLTIRAAAGAGACDTNLTGPTGGTPYTITAPGAVSYNPQPANLSFDAEGRPSAGATIAFSDTTITLTVAEGTGYVAY